jgi:anthranilate phosphoribosyltransferase
MTLTPQQALLRCIEHREIFHDEMLMLFRQIMGGEMSPVMIAARMMPRTGGLNGLGVIAGLPIDRVFRIVTLRTDRLQL